MNPELALESTKSRQSTCFAIAAGLHALLLLWNPIMLRSNITAVHDFVTIDIVEQQNSGAGIAQAPEAPQKMSLMQTLKDMLSKPKEDIAHVAPEISMPKVAAPAQPMLKDMSRAHPMTAFTPKSQTDDLAMANNAAQIANMPRNAQPLQPTAPALKAKSFGGISTRDLPFKMDNDQSIAVGGSNAIPIAVGHGSAKDALAYSGPTLSQKSHRMGITPMTGLTGAPADTPALGAAPSSIPLATGVSGTAPTGVRNTPTLQNKGSTTGGLVNKAMFGSPTTHSSIEGVSASRQLDTQSVNAAGAPHKNKGFDLEGPLGNRPILHKVIPQYPSWAEEQGIVGSVQLYFTVTPDGSVRSNIQVRRTTGYPALDQLGVDALKQWKFAPLQAADEGKGEWGLITFNFSLSS
jgi:TonB family protein